MDSGAHHNHLVAADVVHCFVGFESAETYVEYPAKEVILPSTSMLTE
jgi:hypothetical protein